MTTRTQIQANLTKRKNLINEYKELKAKGIYGQGLSDLVLDIQKCESTVLLLKATL